MPIHVPADVLYDNKALVINSSVTKSVFSKKHNSICYHRLQEAQTAGTMRVGCIDGEYNKSDISTKTKISTKM